MSFSRNARTALNLFDENPEEAAPKQRGIKIQGDGMGKSKEAEKGWWEYGDEPEAPKREQKQGTEPVAGEQGKGTKQEPFDQGNQEEVGKSLRSKEGRDVKEPVAGQYGRGTYDKGNEK